MHAYFSTG